MDMSKFSTSDSEHLKASEFLGRNLKVVISDVSTIEFPAKNDKPAVQRSTLSFEGKDKILVLNASNNKILCTAYGDDSDGWIGHEIGLSTMEYDGFQPGWIVKPLDVAEPDFDDDIPF